MSTHAILIACTLLGQATAADPPPANKYGSENRYTSDNKNTDNKYTGENKYGDAAIPRRNPREATTGATGSAVKQPRPSLGDQFLQQQEAEAKQFQANSSDLDASAADTDDTNWPVQPRSPARVQPNPAQPANPALRGNPLSPANDAAKSSPPAASTNPPRPAVTAQPRTTVEADSGVIAPRPRTYTPVTEEPLPNPTLSDTREAPAENGLRELASELPKTTVVDDRSEAAAIEALSAAFVVPTSSDIKGTPITLSDALAKRGDRESRLRIAHAYWKLASASASYQFAIDEASRVLRPGQPHVRHQNEIDRQLIWSATEAAGARLNESITAVISAQHELAEAIGIAPSDALPLAADAPFLGAYATRFDEIFADRPAPVQLRAIHTTLPFLRQAIVSRAKAAALANTALDRAADAYVDGQTGATAYLAAFHAVSAQRQAFLAVARAYNDDIADYAINVARDGTGAVELTSMLIRVQRSTNSSDASRRTQPPAVRAAETPRRGTAVDRSQPVTTQSDSTLGVRNPAWEPRVNSPLR